MAYSAKVEVKGLDKQVMKLAGFDTVYRQKTYPAMRSVTDLGYKAWQDVAAVDTGFYRDTLQKEVKQVASLLQGRVFTTARSKKGFPYPLALEDSTRYHYRATKRRGQRTAGQVARMFKSLQKTVAPYWKKAADEIIKALKV